MDSRSFQFDVLDTRAQPVALDGPGLGCSEKISQELAISAFPLIANRRSCLPLRRSSMQSSAAIASSLWRLRDGFGMGLAF
jgi:hypothetical protein